MVWQAANREPTCTSNTSSNEPRRGGVLLCYNNYNYFFFGAEGEGRLIVSTTVVVGRRWASFTVMNLPEPASRPIFMDLAMVFSILARPKVLLTLPSRCSTIRPLV